MKAIAPSIINDNSRHAIRNFLNRYIYSFDYIENKKVLDIPCGSGWGLTMCQFVADKIIGAEYGNELIGYAGWTYGLNIQKADMRLKLPFQDNEFDVVLCYEGLEHINYNDGHVFIKEVKRITKPGGLFIGTTPNCMIEETQHLAEGEHQCLYSEKDLRIILGILSNNILIDTDTIGASFLFKAEVDK
jgi:2-polyprenyl-3-methyl-5-hydroxy-6-metoxy-1,4-benzoquinol methylase